MHNLLWQKIIKTRDLFCRVPKDSVGKTLDIDVLVESAHSTASVMVGLTRNTVGRVFAMLRYYCKRDLEDRPIIPFGGRMFVVKCDESQFKHKSKVSQQTATSSPLSSLQRH